MWPCFYGILYFNINDYNTQSKAGICVRTVALIVLLVVGFVLLQASGLS